MALFPVQIRGIFAINELPDLQARIQVSLLNILEEQDIQIRGFNIRFPLDLLMIFSANPEDYTNRGNIITPLKDRIESQILTHYPTTIEIGMAITTQEAYLDRDGHKVAVPRFMREVIEQIAFEARNSEFVDQRSGVSARMTRAALEALISSAERRATLTKNAKSQTRLSDLSFVEAAVTGKVELVYEGEQEGAQNVARLLIGRAVRFVFTKYFPDPDDKRTGREQYGPILDWFAQGHTVTIDPDMSTRTYAERLHEVDGLRNLVNKHVPGTKRMFVPIFMEFVLEALHQASRLGKEVQDTSEHTYSDLMGSMLSILDTGPDDEDEDL